MAKAIRQIEKTQPTPQQEQAQDIAEIVKQIAENREAITTTIEIINELHQAGVLDIVKGLLKTRSKVGAIAIEQMNQPSMHNMIKNGFTAIEFLGSLNPKQLENMLNGLSNGLNEAAKKRESHEQVGLWDMMKSIKDPHVNTALTSMLGFLNGMGKEMENKQTH